ncbi:hypothetical protein C8R43DRAFT_908029 [Mycena crocata]|nr:hypothetical protein C8R43DRAFT_908029 [Mycena crocata]
MLASELKGSMLSDVPGLVEHIFPDECLPLPPSQLLASLLSDEGAPLYTDSKWVGCPDLCQRSNGGDIERELAAFFQSIIERVAGVLRSEGKPPTKQREWSARFATEAVPGAPDTRFPDLLCTDGEDSEWADIVVHAEIKSNANLKSKSYTQLINGAYHAFAAQDDRRFFVALSIAAAALRLVIFDRSGMTIDTGFDIHANPELFIRVLAGITFCEDRARLGYDTSIFPLDGRRFIEAKGHRYELLGPLFISDVVWGRGTVCWHATRDGQYYVIKDIWADTSRPHTEADILRMAEEADVVGVLTVVADVVVQINGVNDATNNIRSIITAASVTKKMFKVYEALEKRVHRRLVLTPYCLPVTSFRSRQELVSIFIDAVTAHRDLVAANILHRDISLNNIMLTTSTAPITSSTSSFVNDPLRRGLLIDVDYALVLNNPTGRTGTSVGHRTGTLPFMAVDVLVYGDSDWAEHEPKHDLESFLYVFIWICWHYAGPGAERKNFDIYSPSHKLQKWVVGLDYEDIGRSKGYMMEHVQDWKRIILQNFAPYFEPLKPCLTAWRQLFVENRLTHDAVLAVLRGALPGLEMEIWSHHDDPAGYGIKRQRKRKREGGLPPIDEDGDEDDDASDDEEEDSEEEAAPECDELPKVYHSAPAPNAQVPRSIIHSMKPRPPIRPAKKHKSSEASGV